MGLLDMFKNKPSPKREQKNVSVRPSSNQMVNRLPVNENMQANNMYEEKLADGRRISIVLPNNAKLGIMPHSKGTKTRAVILAEITEENEDETNFEENKKYVGFEVLREEKITPDILSKIINQYARESKIFPDQKIFYMGEILKNEKEVYFGEKFPSTEKLIKQKVEERDARIAESARRIAEEKRIAEERNEARNAELRKRNEEFENQSRRERRAAPEITEFSQVMGTDGKPCIEFNGVDMYTGKYLRIRNASEVCVDAGGTYLYSAQIVRTDNDSDAEYVDVEDFKDATCKACFTLPDSLENIKNRNNPGQIATLLKLLSDPRNFNYNNNLTYIGGINTEGEIDNANLPSGTIQSRIRELQQSERKPKEASEQDFDER